MELQVTEVEERLDRVTAELSLAQQEKGRLAEELEGEKNHSKVSVSQKKCWLLSNSLHNIL